MAHITAPTRQAKRRRGRPPADLASIVRAWVWLAEVQWAANCSLRALDWLFLGEEHESSRTFWRIKHDGYDPAHKRVSLRNKTLVQVVASNSGYKYTEEVYGHALWIQVLGPSEISFDAREKLISKMMQRLGLFQPDGDDWLINEEMALGEPSLGPSTSVEYLQSLEALTEQRSLDGILLMCLLYLRAMANAHLEAAICLRDEIWKAVNHYCNRPYFDGRLKTCFLHLINRRVLCGTRDLEPSKEAKEIARLMVEGRRKKAATKRAHNQVDELEREWAMTSSFHQNRDLYPLVLVDAKIADYLLQKPSLLARSRKKISARNYKATKRALAKMESSDNLK